MSDDPGEASDISSSWEHMIYAGTPRFDCSHTAIEFLEEVKLPKGFSRKDYSCMCGFRAEYHWFLNGELLTIGTGIHEAPYQFIDMMLKERTWIPIKQEKK